MALDYLPADPAPAYQANKSTTTNILKNDFGDGYSQRAAKGLNNIIQSWELTWTDTASNIDVIEDFLILKAGHTAFYFYPLREITAIQVMCSSWSREYVGPTTDTLTATLTQVFDLT